LFGPGHRILLLTVWRDLAWIYLQWSVCCWFCEALILPRCPAGENDLDPSDGWDLEFYLEAWSLWGREVFRGAERLNMIEPGCSPPRNPSFRRGATLSWTLQCQSCNFPFKAQSQGASLMCKCFYKYSRNQDDRKNKAPEGPRNSYLRHRRSKWKENAGYMIPLTCA